MEWILLLLVMFNRPLFLQARFGDYPSVNLSSSWVSHVDGSWLLPDGSLLQPILLDNSNMLLDFPAVGCGFYSINTAKGNSTFFVVFAAAVSDNSTYLGNSAAILWLANRDNPVTTTAKLKFTSDGDLVLTDTDDNICWSTNTSGKSVVSMSIASPGNLMLHHSYNSIVWQSFDHPTDAWLPGQTLSSEQRLISRVSPTNFSSGLFYLSCSNNGLLAYIEADPPQMYSDALTADFPFEFKLGRLESTGVNSNFTMHYLNKTEYFQYLRLESNGHLRAYLWVQGAEGFSDVPITSLGYCSYPMICGNYGICNNGQCRCPTGDSTGPSYFKEFNSPYLDFGCEEVTRLSCQSSTHHLLLELHDVEYFRFDVDIAHTNSESCQNACLKKCSCKAAIFRRSYSNISYGDCYLPSQIFSLKKSTVPASALSFFIKG